MAAGRISEAVLAPFTRGQIQQFVDRWYVQSAPFLEMPPADAQSRADLLKQAILRTPGLIALAENPLLLTLMASLHAWRGGSLPENREELYHDAVELLLDIWESRKVKNNAGREVSLAEVLQLGHEKLPVLRRLIGELAYEAHAAQEDVTGAANIPEEKLAVALLRLSRTEGLEAGQVEKYLHDRAGLLVAHGVGVYSFPHRTFQEYLAACHLSDDLSHYPDNIADLARRDPNRWREVTLLAGAKAARGAPSSIWQLTDALCYRLLNDPEATRDDAWGGLLAAQVLLETAPTAQLAQIGGRYREKVNLIKAYLTAILTEQVPTAEPFPAVERALAGNLLAQLGDPRPGVGLISPPGRGEGWVPGLPGIAWITIPAGTFTMGSAALDVAMLSEDDLYHWEPITNQQFQAFINANGYDDKRYWPGKGWQWRKKEGDVRQQHFQANPNDDHPVSDLSEYEISAFFRWVTDIWSAAQQPPHRVTFQKPFQISCYPVTNAQYQVFVNDGGYTKQWRECWTKEGWQWKTDREKAGDTLPYKGGGAFDLPNHPVIGVSWYEANAFCAWLTQKLRNDGRDAMHGVSTLPIRLPSEAEWEYAARGHSPSLDSGEGAGGEVVYPWGNDITPEHANYADTGLGATSAVGCFPRGRSAFGCDDLAGNVWEWCEDLWHGNYENAPDDGRAWFSGGGSQRVSRGGSWGNIAPNVRCALRDGLTPQGRNRNLGFRLARRYTHIAPDGAKEGN